MGIPSVWWAIGRDCRVLLSGLYRWNTLSSIAKPLLPENEDVVCVIFTIRPVFRGPSGARGIAVALKGFSNPCHFFLKCMKEGDFQSGFLRVLFQMERRRSFIWRISYFCEGTSRSFFRDLLGTGVTMRQCYLTDVLQRICSQSLEVWLDVAAGWRD